MKAEPGKRYAQVIKGKCHWKFDISTLPEWNQDDTRWLTIDITSMFPEPDEGDLYDGVSFSKPSVPTPKEPDPLAGLREALKADPLLLDKIKALK